SLSAVGLPTGVTATFAPFTLVPTNSSTLTVSTSASTPADSYTITITATGGGKTHTATVTLNVTYEKPVQKIVITLQPDNPYMVVNGVSQEIDPGRGTKPVIIPEWERTVVPIRAIVEALGGTISWEGETRKITINFKGTTIELWIKNPEAEVNGVTKWIDENNHAVMPIIINSRTMLPLRFVAESLGCTVGWDNDTRTITITYGG
ncbi:MAG: copper amine oxidase N-terminal domain-containing protein, partial [Caldisericota bacterium]|nr:copper amine oxidase N-terminal domain-containing protein [Caldisericota bacterium]